MALIFDWFSDLFFPCQLFLTRFKCLAIFKPVIPSSIVFSSRHSKIHVISALPMTFFIETWCLRYQQQTSHSAASFERKKLKNASQFDQLKQLNFSSDERCSLSIIFILSHLFYYYSSVERHDENHRLGKRWWNNRMMYLGLVSLKSFINAHDAIHCDAMRCLRLSRYLYYFKYMHYN